MWVTPLPDTTTKNKYYLLCYYLDNSMPPKPMVVTSVKVDEELWKEAKKKAIDEGITLQDLLNEAVEDWMKKKGKR
jgi:hypothetical protein